MTRYDRNKEYLDQIYYAIGNLYLSRRDTANAIANYVLAAEKSTRNGVEKAFSQITLGGLYFDRHRYDLAQPCYAEAVPLLPDSYPDLALLQRRSDVLDELAVYSQNVTLNDSLLRLAAMPEAERLAVIDKIISDLKKKRKRRPKLQSARSILHSRRQPAPILSRTMPRLRPLSTSILINRGISTIPPPATRGALISRSGGVRESLKTTGDGATKPLSVSTNSVRRMRRMPRPVPTLRRMMEVRMEAPRKRKPRKLLRPTTRTTVNTTLSRFRSPMWRK